MATKTITIDSTSIYGGKPYKPESSKIEYDNKTDNTYRKTEYDTLVVNISYSEFVSAVQAYDTLYNTVGSVSLKDNIEELMTLGVATEQMYKEPYYTEDLISKKTEFAAILKENLKETLSFSFSGDIYNTNYYLVIYPKSIHTVSLEIVPKEVFEKASNTNDQYYMLLVLNTSFNSDELTDDAETTLDSDSVLGIDLYTLPIITYTKEMDKDELCSTNIYGYITNLIKAEERAKSFDLYKEAMKFYETLSDDISTSYGFVVGKATGVSNYFCIREMVTKYHAVNNFGVYTKTKDTFIYGVVLFPYYLELGTDSDTEFYICNDDKKRTLYGRFSQAAVESQLTEDDKLSTESETFPFFGFDYVKKITSVKTKNSVDVGLPKFK